MQGVARSRWGGEERSMWPHICEIPGMLEMPMQWMGWCNIVIHVFTSYTVHYIFKDVGWCILWTYHTWYQLSCSCMVEYLVRQPVDSCHSPSILCFTMDAYLLTFIGVVRLNIPLKQIYNVQLLPEQIFECSWLHCHGVHNSCACPSVHYVRGIACHMRQICCFITLYLHVIVSATTTTVWCSAHHFHSTVGVVCARINDDFRVHHFSSLSMRHMTSQDSTQRRWWQTHNPPFLERGLWNWLVECEQVLLHLPPYVRIATGRAKCPCTKVTWTHHESWSHHLKPPSLHVLDKRGNAALHNTNKVGRRSDNN